MTELVKKFSLFMKKISVNGKFFGISNIVMFMRTKGTKGQRMAHSSHRRLTQRERPRCAGMRREVGSRREFPFYHGGHEETGSGAYILRYGISNLRRAKVADFFYREGKNKGQRRNLTGFTGWTGLLKTLCFCGECLLAA